MSSDFERLLREARDALPEPDGRATRRAWAKALATVRPRRRRGGRRAALVGATLVLVLAAGVGLGTLIAPTGTAAKGPVGLGFLPEPGWFVLQSTGRATEGVPAIAFASNVPFSREDDIHGLAEQSGLPYASLLALPPHGIVIVASFSLRGEPWRDVLFSSTRLPLRVSDALPGINYSAQVRPEQPLGQYQIRALVNSHNVDVHLYFGVPNPSAALRADAQRQLDRLVVRSERTPIRARTPQGTPSARSAPGIVDRTLLCTVVARGGLYEIEARAHEGYRSDARWARLPYVVVASGHMTSQIGGSRMVHPSTLVWTTAGAPTAATTVDSEFLSFPVLNSGTLGVSPKCRPSTKRVPLTRTGLKGGSPGTLGAEFDCAAPRRVLVRVRASLGAATSLHRRGDFLATTKPLREAQVAVRTVAGRPLLYAEVGQAGSARLFTGRGCSPG